MFDFNKNTYLNKHRNPQDRCKKRKFFLITIIITVFLIFFISGKDKFKKKNENKKKNFLIPSENIKKLLKKIPEKDFTKKYFTVPYKKETLVIHTTINKKLQSYIESEINNSLNKGDGAPELIGFAVMDPFSGEILGLKGYDSLKKNPCTRELYPSASLFKIITAAAAIETKGYKPDKKMWFNGGKYTLYRRQLSLKKNKYTNYIRFKDAFAQSVNPVFGKLGYYDLRKEKLTLFSSKFRFNHKHDSDIFIQPSIIKIDGNKYHWAEAACGFNNSTKITILHAAMINTAVVNKGLISKPYLLKKVVDDKKNIRYEHKKNLFLSAIKESTAMDISKMMQRTITRGTAKNSFKSSLKVRIMKNLLIGGKTGSLFNISNTVKYDWFSGFAIDKTTGKGITIAIIVGHGKYLGTRAATYARRLISNYFNNLS